MPETSSPLSVELVKVVKRYGTPQAPVMALNKVSLTVGQNERLAVLGKSGSGKSTLLNLLGGLDRPTEGRVTCVCQDLGRLNSRELSRFRSMSVGMIFQSFNLILSRTALENVELPMIFSGCPPTERRRAARDVLVRVGLGKRLDHRPSAMSGGENQRVAVARALVNKPKLILADEPTGNLDSSTARDVMQTILDYAERQQAALVLITHDEDLARSSTSRIIRLKDGEMLCD